MASVLVEAGDGPDSVDSDRFNRELGFAPLIEVHRGLRITEEQRKRLVPLHMAALDATGLPGNEEFRGTIRSHADFGSQVAMQNSHAETEDQLHPLLVEGLPVRAECGWRGLVDLARREDELRRRTLSDGVGKDWRRRSTSAYLDAIVKIA